VPRCYDCAQSGGQSTALNGLSRLAADTAPLPPARLADTRAFSEVVMLGSARCLGPSVVSSEDKGQKLSEFALVHGQGEVGLAVQRQEAADYMQV
jgi:hypothetical protein